MAGGVIDAGIHQGGVNAKSVAGSSNVTLTATERECTHQIYSGVLGAAISVIAGTPADLAGMFWTVGNFTTGDFNLTFIGSSGTGVVIPPNTRQAVFCDGTNFVAVGMPVGTWGDGNRVGAPEVIFRIDVPAGATGDVDKTLVSKHRIIDAWLVKRSAAGGGAGTIQLKNSTNAITDAMSINVADETVVRAATLSDANWEIAAGGTLRATRTRTASTDETCTVYARGIPVA